MYVKSISVKKIFQLTILLFFVFNQNTIAQPAINSIDNYLFQRTNIVFSVTPTYTFKGKSTLLIGNQNMTTQNLMSAEAGLSLIFNVSDKWGVKTGFQVGAYPFDWGYSLNSNYDTLPGYQSSFYSGDFSPFDRDYFGYLNIPLQLEYRKKITPGKYFLGAGGVNLKWTNNKPTGFGFGAYINDTTSIDILNIYAKPAEKYLSIPLSLSAGIGFVLKNKNMLVLNVKSEIGFADLIHGSFAFFPDEPYRSVGTYTKKGSYIGLEIGYRLTKARQTYALNSPSGYTFAKNEGHINHKIDGTDFEKIFRRNQIGISIGYQFNLKPTIKTDKGSKPNVTVLPMPMLSADYTFNIDEHWGIKTGFEMGTIFYKYNNVNYFDSVFNRNHQVDFKHYEGTYTLNVAVNYRCPISRIIYLEGNAGLNTTRLFNGGTTYSYGYDFKYPFAGQHYVKGATSDKFLLGSKVGLGLLFANKNYNLWRIGIDYKYSFSAATSESYAFNRGYANEQTGTLKAKGSFVAISAGYIYSFSPSPYAVAKRRMKIETMEQFPKARVTAKDLDTIYTKNQMALTGQLNFMITPTVTATAGATPYAYTYGTLGLAADYLFNFNKNWSVITGASIGRYSYDADYFDRRITDTARYSFSYENYTTSVGVNAAVEYRIPLGRKNLWYNNLGICVNGTFTNSYDYTSQTTPSQKVTTINDFNSNSFNAGAKMETGILLTFKNHNQLKFGVKYYQSFTPIMEQDYSITNAASQTIASGKITASGSYIGLNAGYVFSFKKKK